MSQICMSMSQNIFCPSFETLDYAYFPPSITHSQTSLLLFMIFPVALISFVIMLIIVMIISLTELA